MTGINIYTPFSLLPNQSGDLVQGILYIWNFANEFKKEINVTDTSFKTILTTLFYEHLQRDDWITIKIFQYLIPPLLRHLELIAIAKMQTPIDITTISMLVAIIMEKDGSEFCMNVMRYIRNGRFITNVEPRTKVSILVKMIQMYFQTNEGKTKSLSKRQTKVIGVDSMYRYFIVMNDFLIVETYELNWMIVDNKVKMMNLINYYAKSKYEREIELSKHLKIIQPELKYETELYQEFGISTENIHYNFSRIEDYYRFSIPMENDMSENNKIKEITNNVIDDGTTFCFSILKNMEKRNKSRIKGLQQTINLLTNLKNSFTENGIISTTTSTLFSTMMKTIQKLPVPYQDQKYYKKLIKIVTMECMSSFNLSTLKMLILLSHQMVDLKNVRIHLDVSSYDDISFSSEENDGQMNEEYDSSNESMDNIVSSEDKMDEDNESSDSDSKSDSNSSEESDDEEDDDDDKMKEEEEEEIKIVKPTIKRGRKETSSEEDESSNESSDEDEEDDEESSEVIEDD